MKKDWILLLCSSKTRLGVQFWIVDISYCKVLHVHKLFFLMFELNMFLLIVVFLQFPLFFSFIVPVYARCDSLHFTLSLYRILYFHSLFNLSLLWYILAHPI